MACFDKFYTKSDVALSCINFLKEKVDCSDKEFLEPSAGDGKFLQYLDNYIAYDIKPENENIIEADFLTVNLPKDKGYITIGNPPFGKRSQLAIDFFNRAALFSDVIAFIVPVSFMKWSVQKQLNNNFALLDYFYLEPNSFLDKDKDFSVRCVFQIWINKNSNYTVFEDKRLKKNPPISHEDFDIWQYNATKQSLNVIDNDWTIATYRQGYHDYNNLFTQKDKDDIYERMTRETKKQQFFFIKPKTEQAKNIILSMDFNALAERNTSTPGFGKGDFVSYYMELKSNI